MVTRWVTLNKPHALASPRFSLLDSEPSDLCPFCPSGLLCGSHELTELEGKLDNVNNYCIAVKERGDDIVFLRKIVPGGADKSFGIQVAKIAGVPDAVIRRAKEISDELANSESGFYSGHFTIPEKKEQSKMKQSVELEQFSLFDTVKDDTIIEELRSVNISTMTPLEALNKLHELHNKVKNRW